MANITASDVNKLRQMTGTGMMDCKNALVEAEGDFEKAIETHYNAALKAPNLLYATPISQLDALVLKGKKT